MNSHDTTVEAARIQAEVIRRMGPNRRLELAFQMSETVRDLARARLRAQHPTSTPAEIQDLLVFELYGYRRHPE